MNWLDRILLLATGACALFTVTRLIGRKPRANSTPYHVVALAVLLVSGLLLVIFEWDILGLMGSGLSNRLVAIVASLIPFSWATGVVVAAFPKAGKGYLALMSVGLVLIVISRFLSDPAMARIVYPLFPGTAGLTIIVLPPATIKRSPNGRSYLLVSLGGLLISVGRLVLSFLLAGRQLAFFSSDMVLTILAPLLLMAAVLYGTGLLVGTNPAASGAEASLRCDKYPQSSQSRDPQGAV